MNMSFFFFGGKREKKSTHNTVRQQLIETHNGRHKNKGHLVTRTHPRLRATAAEMQAETGSSREPAELPRRTETARGLQTTNKAHKHSENRDDFRTN